MILVDDRTQEERDTHYLGVAMTDRVLSGWGAASGGPSFAVWACNYYNVAQVERWVRSIRAALRVRRVALRTYAPRGNGHCHIYVVSPGHPSLTGTTA